MKTGMVKLQLIVEADGDKHSMTLEALPWPGDETIVPAVQREGLHLLYQMINNLKTTDKYRLWQEEEWQKQKKRLTE